MWQHLAADPGLQRALVLLVPVLAVAGTLLLRPPSERRATAAFVAFMWNVALLVPANVIAMSMGWWQFRADGSTLLAVPLDVMLGWAALWGALPALLYERGYVLVLIGGLVGLDLIAMPHLGAIVTLGDWWLLGELFVVATCLVPGIVLARFTEQDAEVGVRAAGQAVVTGVLFLGLLPAAVLELTGGSIASILEMSPWQLSAAFNALLVPIVLGLSATQEFAVVGRGTPIPFDPPKRLVMTGPYAYVANPMQIAIALALVVIGLVYASAAILAAAVMCCVFSAGFVFWHQQEDIRLRFGSGWSDYRAHVGNWLPRWRPYIPAASAVYFDRDCGICRSTEAWIRTLGPAGLAFEDAKDHPSGFPARVAYRHASGFEEQGIGAIARCLDHVHLGFAFLGWFMRLPVIRQGLQILIDGTGEQSPRACIPGKRD